MSQQEAREWLADSIALAAPSGVQIYRYAVESPSVPCIMLADGDPVVELRAVGVGVAALNLRIVCLVPMLDSESSQQLLEALTDHLLNTLPRDMAQFSLVGSTSTMDIGEAMYYAREIPVQLKFALGE